MVARIKTNQRGVLPKTNGKAHGKSRKPQSRQPTTKPVDHPRSGSDPPDDLSALGRRKWAEVAGFLLDQNLFTVADRDGLMLYCLSYESLIQAIAVLKKEGLTVAGRTGQLTQHPAQRTAKSATDTMIRLQNLYGMSPMCRSRMQVIDEDGTPTSDEDEIAYILGE